MKAGRTNTLITLLLLAAVCASAPSAASAQTKRRKKVAVIGTERAKADAAERRRVARGGQSPMPPGKYEVRREELGLIRPKPNAYDDALAEMCRRYASGDARTRARTRRSLAQEEFYKLIGFAEREAVFGLRSRGAEKLADGLTALAMIEVERVDERDLLVSLSLLNHSAVRIGADVGRLFRDAAALAEPATSRLIVEFNDRTTAEKDLRAAWGHDEVETEAGLGFISFGIDEYDPTYDLKKVSIHVADLLLADKYIPTSVEVGYNLPPVWLESDDNTRLERAMRAVRAGAGVSADRTPFDVSHMFAVFILELADESSARTLLDLSNELAPSREREKGPFAYSMLGVAEGRLFCLVVARPFAEGAKPVESRESLGRFREGLAEILRRHTTTPKAVANSKASEL
jgi:hypothetical protein